MSVPQGASLPGFNISAVERETGLSKDLLRMWERRYGFPSPARDAGGERLYSPAEVARLRAIKRLMDAGMRPGRIVHRSLEELDGLADARSDNGADDPTSDLVREALALVRSHDASGLQKLLIQQAMRQGLQQFVLATVAPLNRAVGAAWAAGDLQVFEEHHYTESVHAALRSAINAFPRSTEGTPRVLLTTFPRETHHLGLLMVEALLVPEGAQCISLGTQTPVGDVARATLAHRANLLALSFSAAYPLRAAVDGLGTLRAQLPPSVTIWAGGELARRLRKPMPGVTLIPDLASVIPTLRSSKLASGARPGD